MRWSTWRYPARWPIFKSDDRLMMVLFAVVVGMFSGLASVLLMRALEALFDGLSRYRIHWWAFVIPGIGAALSSIFLEKIVREGSGHGVPEVIYSVSRHGGLLRFRSSITRLVSGALTIGSGGSAGPEGPVVISGAAIGSAIARMFALNERQRVTLVGCGAAGAIASIFNAPIAGLVFAVELVLGEWSAKNIIPIAISAVAGTELCRQLEGNRIYFAHHRFHITISDILACAIFAAVCAAASVLLTRLMKNMTHLAEKTPAPLWARAAIGGCATGLIGLVFPDILGEGYHAIQVMIGGTFAQGLVLAALLTIAKMLATSTTLGWGGSGGIFAPCLVIGSFTGLTFYRFFGWAWPGLMTTGDSFYALLGMAGLISGILQAPLTGIFLIVEITGGYDVILPLIIVSALTASLCHLFEPASFYLRELVERGHLLRPGTDARVLSDLSIPEVLETDCIPVPRNMLLRDFIKVIKKSHRHYFPVEDPESGEFVGLIQMDDIRPYLFNPIIYDAVILEQIMNTDVVTVNIQDDVAYVLNIMDTRQVFSLPVLSKNRFVGMVSKATLLDQYGKDLIVQTSS